MSSLNFNTFKKKAISFLLLICMIFSIVDTCYISVSALAGKSVSDLPIYTGGQGEGASIGWVGDGLVATKVTVVQRPDVLNTANIGSGDFITINNSAKTVAYRDDATTANMYTDESKCFWVAWESQLDELYWAVPSGGAISLSGRGNAYDGSGSANTALGISGVDWHDTDSINKFMWNDASGVANLITNFYPNYAGKSNDEIFKDFYIVVEMGGLYQAGSIRIAVPPQVGYYNEANFVNGKCTLQSSLGGMQTSHASKIFDITSIKADTTEGWTKASNCSRPQKGNITWDTEGYGVYIPAMMGVTSGSGALNVTVEYKGEPDTSDAAKFVANTSLANKAGGAIQYFDLTTNTWKPFGANAKKDLNFTVIETSKEYATIFADTYSTKLTSPYSVAELLNKTNLSASSGYQLNWGSKAITAGLYNVGYAFTVNSIDGYISTQAIANKLTSGIGGMSVWNRVATNISSASDVVASCHNNFKKAIDSSSTGSSDELGVAGLVNDAGKITVNQNFGLGIEFIAKGKPVTSTKYTINVDSQAGRSTSSKSWTKDYSSVDKYTVCPIENGVTCWLVVPNSNAVNADTIGSAVLNSGVNSASAVLTVALSTVSGVVAYRTDGGYGIGLGCTKGTTEGYTVYEIIVANESKTGKLELPSYMLNRYFNEVITFSNHIKEDVPLSKAYWVTAYKDNTAYNYTYTGAGSLCGTKLPTDYERSWKISYTDISSGTIIGYDTGDLLGRYLLKGKNQTHKLWGSMTRANLANGSYASINTRHINTKNYTMDYAFNLIRAGFGDKRSISGIRYSTYDGIGDNDDMLKLKSDFGVKPKTIKEASSIRSSLATTGNILTEKIAMEAKFTKTGSNKASRKYATAVHSCSAAGTCNCDLDEGETCTTDHTQYCSLNGTEYIIFKDYNIRAFGLNNTSPASKFSYSWKNIAYKYQTDVIETGKNDTLGDSTMAPIGTSAKNPNEGSVSSTNFYRYATVHDNNITLKFYPEVKMATKIGGTEFDSTPYKSVYTMGEKERTAESSMLYLYKLTGDGTDISGTTYSDSALGGSSSKNSNKKVTIPAGSDVYITANPNVFSIDLFAYGLDIIDPDYDGSINEGANYNTIVASDADVKEEWGNGDNYTAMHTNFSNWCDAMLDIKNYAADFELKVDNYTGNNITNFSASVGKIERNNSIDSDKSWNLVIENGELVKDKGGYNKLIQSIEADYGCSKDEAEALFEASGLYTSIINGIEASNDEFNKSGVAIPTTFDGNDNSEKKLEDSGANWTNELGGNGNWYDEKTRTVVVRRYANTGNKIKDITAVDKIDYGLAPNSTGTDKKQNINGGNVKGAKWYVNIFFNPDKKAIINGNLLGDATYYNPTNGSSELSTANDKYTVLVNKAPVKDADFYISAESTSGF